MADSQQYSVSLVATQPRTIAAVHGHLPIRDIPSRFASYLNEVYAAAKEGSVQLDGQNVFVYFAVPPQPADAHIAFGVGITAPFEAVGNVVPTDVPGGECAMVTHHGSYAKLGPAHTAITEWCKQTGHQKAGPSWEVYGHWTEDEARLTTDVFYLLLPESGTAA